MRNAHCRTWNMARNNKNVGNEMQRVGPGVWRETRKKWTMRPKHRMTWNMERNTQKHGK